MVMAFNNEFLSKFFLQIDEQVHRINRLFLLKESVTCKDQAFLYSDIAAQIHSLQALVNKIKVILEHEKQSLAQAQSKCNQMMLLHEQVDSMMIFSLQNSCKDVSSQILSTSSDKENTQKAGESSSSVPARIPKKGAKRKMGVPSLNAISKEEFLKVPKYMKGRLTLEQLNSGITDVNLILSKKYDLFNRRRKDLSLKDEQLRSVYLEQGKDLKGTCYSIFFVNDDIQRFSSTLKLQHKTRDSILLILRHLGRMKEMHKGKLNRYCIVCA